ncbi:hypothetical protein BpHYR1_016406 [Brachionus plicatilis]|uniref:Uncharacterized protein n=1 Tax=Brachionus plicatilis TaxID=10195 RepID=A0A3M7T203_BRAPC|nr:hypothetical protein BpHYR1_016406 [Brachionus plicatilis]
MPPKGQKKKKNPPKTKKKKNETDSSKIEPQKPKPKDDEIEILPIIYEVPDIDHQFHHLNKKPASVDISKICEGLDKEENIEITLIGFCLLRTLKEILGFLTTFTIKLVEYKKIKYNFVILLLYLLKTNFNKYKSTRISFLHGEEGNKTRATKFIKENNTDYKPNLEKTLKEISTQLFQLNQKFNQPVNQNISDQIGVKSAQPETLISPRLKRRAATPELIESEDELSNIYTQKDFTNELRKKLKEKFPDDLNKTIAYLKKFVPSKSDFSTAWFNATNSFRKVKYSVNYKNIIIFCPLDFDYEAGNILTNFKKFTSNRNFVKHNMSQKNCN